MLELKVSSYSFRCFVPHLAVCVLPHSVPIKIALMTQQCEARARDFVGSCRVCQVWNQDAIDFDELS